MKYILSISLILCLCSCASWSTREKVAAGTMIAAQMADHYTTEKMLDRGAWENNPVLGRHPSDRELTLYFSVTTPLKLLFAHLFPDHREWILYGFTAVSGYAAYNNYRLIKDLERR
ncbi:hypothetical protein ES703_113666 [subsurface metagenome]